MGRGTTIVDRLNKLSGKDATTIPKALEYLEEEGIGGDVDWNINDPEAKGYISNRPFYEYDDFENEEYWDFAEEFAESSDFSAKTFKKRTNESGIYYAGSPYRFSSTKRPTTHLFRDIFEEGKAYKVKLFFDSEFFPEMEYIYIPSVYGNEIYPVSTAFDTVSFPTDYGDFVCFYHAKVGSYYAAIASCKFYVAGADDGSQADTFPDTLTFTNLKVYRLKPVKKVKKIDEKYLPIKGLNVHICTSEEYDSSTLVPTVTNPDASTLYLVPTSSKSKNMFDEYVWTGTDWEKFGTGSVALPSPTTSDNGKVLGVDGGEYKLVEQSGGAEVEFIKIMDVTIPKTDARFAGGGSRLLNSKSLGELIGNKTIIGVVVDNTNILAANVNARSLELITNQKSLLNDYSFGIQVVGASDFSYDVTTSVYVICI